ncbi:Imm63 family immunity protein [Feifania hominis]|uniref:Immunity protein 63 domain-containing protein n=1 Tax=Feifania hominis TaxID=2763660 RepID=A0A926HUL8_9FIRM|nr:Imm63 family immunity protein [Feifania hominis]MBC8536433.1 hypothetical protein [Feifania hominis]
MLKTHQLEREIKNCIYDVLPGVNMERFKFSVGTDNSPEGIYIYSQDGAYHWIFTERGKVRDHKILNSEEDVLWYVLDEILFDIALDFAEKNMIKGEDFRRQLFKKEIELYSKFGDFFKKRKIAEIEKILKSDPYRDTL